MANYNSYKQISNTQITDGTITTTQLQTGAFSNWCVKWFYGSPNACQSGCCCNWTVPTGVQRATWELWGSGGNGHGQCSCNRCGNWSGAQGGYYNTKTITTSGGCSYTVCAGGVYPCYSRNCSGCSGCSSYVNGYNLSGFCAIGGHPGCYSNNWSTSCFSTQGRCCMSPGAAGGDFAMGNHQGAALRYDGFNCHCFYNEAVPTGAPFIGTLGVSYGVRQCWIRCGCWSVPYGHGGQGAIGSYCGSSCCGQGGTGGGGLVKVTYV